MNSNIGNLTLLFSIDCQLREQGSAAAAAKRLAKQRDSVRGEISKPFLSSYDALMREGRYPPFVEARGSHCGGCNLRLTPQLACALRRGEGLLACPHCRRLLFSAFDSDSPGTARPDLRIAVSASCSGSSLH
ncbi:MAG TPA: C4-type zinc ribbon domain-containing protein [Thermoanaerobaculia bacterium]|nr:C4-type zinc ribbon domain-containing protein [Thermoanaerobaculia bacterium]HTQ08633.1 C4-type zinc ribbon domain-containing protein [Fimbriimonadaceae bacterium]